VNGTHADSLFGTGNFQKAAQFYAKSNFSFEAVTLKFIKAKQIKSLEIYLEKVLEVYKQKREQDEQIKQADLNKV